MAGLFDVPKRSGRSLDSAIAKKVNSKSSTKPSVTVKGGGGLLERIAAIKAMVDKHLGHYREKYITIQTEEELTSYIDKCIETGFISIDTETTGLDPILNSIAGICIYTPGQQGAYVPLHHKSYVTGIEVEGQLSVEFVRQQFERLNEFNVKVIMFNACFDLRFLRNQVGVRLKCYWDCYLAARLLNENEGAGNNGLKPLHRKYVLNGKGDAFKFDDLFKGISFDLIPIQTGYLYAAHDAVITFELFEFQEPYLTLDNPVCVEFELENVAWVFHNIEMPCVMVVADMEDNGIAFDLEYAEQLSVKYNEILQQKTENFYKLCEMYEVEIDTYKATHSNHKLDNPINIGSSSQLAVLLYDILKLDPPDPKKPRGTGEDILSKLDNPLCKAILEYREVAKLISTYVDKLPNCVNPRDGRIHCKFNQYGADTGRFSSNDPNLQNIPSHNKEIRKMFVASPGYVLMSSDYSQQEPKVMTQMCGDEKMINAYKNGKDLYAEIASLAFGVPYEECLEFRPDGTTNPDGKARRSSAKSILLGILYGRGINSVADQLHTTKQKAQEIQDKVFKGFPAIPKFENDSKRMALEEGFVTTLWGRKRRLPDLALPEFEFTWINGAPPDDDPLSFDSDEEVSNEVSYEIQQYYLKKLQRYRFGKKKQVFDEALSQGIKITDNGAKIADAERQVVNARIQGSAADMSKLAIIKVGTDERLKELGFRLLIPVHDELIGECPIENAKEAAERFAMLMSCAAESKLTVPISCDVEITTKWYGEAVKL